MIRKLILAFMLLGLFLMSSCATEKYSSSSSDDYYPKYNFTYKEMCGYGAVYCGPGP